MTERSHPAGDRHGDLIVERDGPVLRVTFDRPHAHNALTFAMYEGLHDACVTADADPGIRVLVVRGAGGRAFVSGTDIAQFAGFDGPDGVAYEERITRVVRRLEDTAVPTVAAIDGYCIGGGLALAAACDLRIATRASRFGVPIARTLGNCLSMDTIALLVSHLGRSRALDMLLRARLLDAAEAAAAGFVTQLAEDAAGLDAVLADTVRTLASHAPLSMWASKQMLTRLRRAGLPDGDDIVERVYGSADFQDAVAAFAAKERPTWKGE
jgi:enoyl-CoA hydratase/carnithine racemase